MSSYIAAFALHRAVRPVIRFRHFSSLVSSLDALRVLASKTLTPSRILSPISVPFAFTKVVNAEDKIRRTDGDVNLLSVLNHKTAEQASLENELPNDSPFEITEERGCRSVKLEQVKLKREFQGEKIEVFVYKYFDGDADEKESEQDAAEGQNTDDNCRPHIPLFVTIDKAGTALVFYCNLYAEDLDIVRAMMRRPKDSDEGFDYSRCINLDEGLQKAFNEYLGVRGIKVSLYKFLREYFQTMDDRRYIARLKKLKEFVMN